jgi:hypothetical protein
VIILMILGEECDEYKLLSSSFINFLHSPVASSIFVSNIRIKTSCKLGVLVRQDVRFHTHVNCWSSVIPECGTTQEIHRLWNPKVDYRFTRARPLFRIVSRHTHGQV